jgi:UDP-N-acetylglucosamine 1-carboxyvinyltransferase
MSSFEIIGGKKLKGEIIPQGAKNEALQVICAVLLTPEKVTISNIPNIRDVNKLIELLKDLGVKAEEKSQGEYVFQADNVNLDFMYTDDFKQKATSLRGSIMIIGPLPSRHPLYRTNKSWR